MKKVKELSEILVKWDVLIVAEVATSNKYVKVISHDLFKSISNLLEAGQCPYGTGMAKFEKNES